MSFLTKPDYQEKEATEEEELTGEEKAGVGYTLSPHIHQHVQHGWRLAPLQTEAGCRAHIQNNTNTC